MSVRRLSLALSLTGALGLPVVALCGNPIDVNSSRGPVTVPDTGVRGATHGSRDASEPVNGAVDSAAWGSVERDNQQTNLGSDASPRQSGRVPVMGRSNQSGSRLPQDPYAGSVRTRTARSAVLDTGVRQAPPSHGTDMSLPKSTGQGLNVRALNDDERRDLDIPSGGLKITSVGDGSAFLAGFRPGDVVLMLNGVAVSTPDQFCKLLHAAPHDHPMPVLVHRPGVNLFLPLDPPAH